MSLDKNVIAQQLLQEVGFSVEPEPQWIGGREVPDFFCTGPIDLWVEVKAISEAERFRQLQIRAQWLWDRVASVEELGSAHAWIGEHATERDAKAAIALTRDAFRGWAKSPDRVYVVVPCDPDYSKRVTITVATRGGTETLFCLQSRTGRYGRPQIGEELTGRSVATLIGTDGSTYSADPFELGLGDDDFVLGLSLERGVSPFRIVGIAPTGPAQRITTTQTVRIAAKKANSQFKSAYRVRPAPCLLMVFQDGLAVQSPLSFASAFYGDLLYQFPRSKGEEGRTSFGSNGIWSPEMNRTTSAAALVRNVGLPIRPDGVPVLVTNPWAAMVIPRTVLPWPAAEIHLNGEVRFPD